VKFIKQHMNMVIHSLVRVVCSCVNHYVFDIASAIILKLFLLVIWINFGLVEKSITKKNNNLKLEFE